jgi:outer membrane lipoprotein-sorting protein
VLLNKQETEANYTISLEEDKDLESTLTWVLMQPKLPSDEVKLVWLGIQQQQLAILKLQNQMDNIVVFEFNDIKKNPKFEDDFFTFIAPEGTDIIQDTVIEAY